MNPGYEAVDEYNKFRTVIKKIKTITALDGLDINDNKSLEAYRSKEKKNLFTFSEQAESNNTPSASPYLESIAEEVDENDINNIIKMKKRQSTITYSQRMLKKADNLTKFNRKNHSEGNKHITNNDL